MTINNILGYSTFASANTDVGGVSIVENCAAANLNNGIRAVMADLAKHVGDTSGKLVTTGAPNAYIIANTDRIIAGYADGLMLSFKAGFTNTGSSTINIDSKGARVIRTLSGDALPAGAIAINGIYTIAYSSVTASFYLMTPAIQTKFAGIVSVANGGTGLTAYGVGDLICASASTTLSRLPDVALGNVLMSGGVGLPPFWGKPNLVGNITGVLPIANGGTNASIASGVSLDNITGFAGTGQLARTAAGTYAFRTAIGTVNQIDILNGAGIAGNPTFSLSPVLALRDKTVQLKDLNTTIVDDVDVTKVLKFECSGISPGALRTMTIPDASGTLVLLNGANTYTSPQTITQTAPTVNLTLSSTDGNTLPGPGMNLFRNSASPFANDYLGYLDFQGKDSAGATVSYGQIRSRVLDATTVTGVGELEFFTIEAGTPRMEMEISKGVNVGLPAGGYKGFGSLNAQTLWLNGVALGSASVANMGTSGATVPALNGINTWSAAQTFGAVAVNGALTPNAGMTVIGGVVVGAPSGANKGDGTINISGDIFKNNAAYTNPDFVFESFYSGKVEKFADNFRADKYQGLMPIGELRDYTRQHLRLPGLDGKPAGTFERSDIALEKIEELTLYILELHERIRLLELQISGDGK